MELLLLHHCCGPCSPQVIEQLRTTHRVESYWFNPNIQPQDEHDKRLDAFKLLGKVMDLAILKPEPFSGDQWSKEALAAGAKRCEFCYRFRLRETARAAKNRGAAAFSTTLLASPHQKHEMIRELGEAIGNAEGCTFLYKDFRPFYYKGKDFAYHKGLYMQKYCGCLFSKEERAASMTKKA